MCPAVIIMFCQIISCGDGRCPFECSDQLGIYRYEDCPIKSVINGKEDP